MCVVNCDIANTFSGLCRVALRRFGTEWTSHIKTSTDLESRIIQIQTRLIYEKTLNLRDKISEELLPISLDKNVTVNGTEDRRNTATMQGRGAQVTRLESLLNREDCLKRKNVIESLTRIPTVAHDGDLVSYSTDDADSSDNGKPPSPAPTRPRRRIENRKADWSTGKEKALLDALRNYGIPDVLDEECTAESVYTIWGQDEGLSKEQISCKLKALRRESLNDIKKRKEIKNRKRKRDSTVLEETDNLTDLPQQKSNKKLKQLNRSSSSILVPSHVSSPRSTKSRSSSPKSTKSIPDVMGYCRQYLSRISKGNNRHQMRKLKFRGTAFASRFGKTFNKHR